MKMLFPAVLIVIMLLSTGSSSFGANKKSKSAPAPKPESPTPAAEKASPEPTPAGWHEVRTNSPNDAKVTYKVEGTYLIIQFRNLSRDKTIRIKYQAKWKRQEKGKWIEDGTAEGLTIRLRKKEDFRKEIATHTKDIKDILVTADVSEV